MRVYIIIEYRSCGDRIIWGVFSSYGNAKSYLNHMHWNKNTNIGIVDYEVDEKVRW